MTPATLAALLPLAVLGLGAVAAMLAAAFAPRAAPGLAAAAHTVAGTLVLSRLGAPPEALPLLVDDTVGRAGTLLASLAGLFVLALPRVAREAPAIVALASAGTAAAAASTHAASIVLALEIVTLATVALAAAPRDTRSLEAAVKLLIPSGAATSAMLLGFALQSAAGGGLLLAATGAPGVLAATASALILFGLVFKLALVPAHMWAPDLFDGAPASAAAVAALLSKTAVVLVLLRLLGPLPAGHALLSAVVLLGAASVLLGNLAAIRQARFRRLLGWSSVSQSGYLAILVAAGRGDGVVVAVFVALAAYVPAIGAALAVGRAAPPASEESWLARAAALLALVSLAGLPAAGGFVAKLLILGELAWSASWFALATVMLGSALGFFAYLRFSLTAGINDVDPGGAEPAPRHPPSPVLLVAAMAVMLAIGIAPGPLAALLAPASR
jgi:NADH-quinone oxidoreductase subunit N